MLTSFKKWQGNLVLSHHHITYMLSQSTDKEGITYEDAALEVIAEKSDGGMRDALSIFDQESKFTYERSFRLADDIDTENIKVSLENGVLSFALSKKQAAAARKLTID